MNEFILTYRKLVKPDDLNHANTLFGGKLLQWSDEAAVIYAMCQIGSKSIVTLKMSEVLFKNPARSGDVLEFWTRKSVIGNSSLAVECIVVRKEMNTPQERPQEPVKIGDKFKNPNDIILSCEFSFVHVDSDGRPIPHKLSSKK